MERRRRNDLHRLDVYRCALELYRRVGAPYEDSKIEQHGDVY